MSDKQTLSWAIARVQGKFNGPKKLGTRVLGPQITADVRMICAAAHRTDVAESAVESVKIILKRLEAELAQSVPLQTHAEIKERLCEVIRERDALRARVAEQESEIKELRAELARLR